MWHRASSVAEPESPLESLAAPQSKRRPADDRSPFATVRRISRADYGEEVAAGIAPLFIESDFIIEPALARSPHAT